MCHRYLLLIAASLLVSFRVSVAEAQTLLRVATPGALTGALPIYLGAKKGVFQKYGLTVLPVPLEYIWGINLTRKALINKNRDIVKNYLRGLAESVRLMMVDKAATLTIMSQVLKIEDIESLEYSYKIMRDNSRPDFFPTEEAIVNVLKTMVYEDPAFGSIPPYKFFDLSLIQELKAERK